MSQMSIARALIAGGVAVSGVSLNNANANPSKKEPKRRYGYKGRADTGGSSNGDRGGGRSALAMLGTGLGTALVFAGGAIALAVSCFKKCPSNRVMVINGAFTSTKRVGAGPGTRKAAKIVHGGGSFVLPVVQEHAFLSTQPITIDISLKGALSLENIRVDVPSVFTVAIGTSSPTIDNAAVRLLGMTESAISHQASEIIIGQLRQVVAIMSIEKITRDRETFSVSVQEHVEGELNKVGLTLLNTNIQNITDESGFIEARGRKAAAEAIEKANVDVAEREKTGAIGVAQANRDKNVQVSLANKDQTVGVTEADKDKTVSVAALEAETVKGQNQSAAIIADSKAQLKVAEAESFKLGETRRLEAEARVKESAAIAEAKAFAAIASKIEAEKRSELEAPAKATRAQIMVEAEAEADRLRIIAQGNADATVLKAKAAAQAEYEMLSKKAMGLEELVRGCGGSQAAFQLLMLEHMDHLADTSAKAISNIKFDKVVVWDGGRGGAGDGEAAGRNATSDFIRGVAKSLPPTLDMMKDVSGVDMPQYFQSIANGVGGNATVDPTAVSASESVAEIEDPGMDDSPTEGEDVVGTNVRPGPSQ